MSLVQVDFLKDNVYFHEVLTFTYSFADCSAFHDLKHIFEEIKNDWQASSKLQLSVPHWFDDVRATISIWFLEWDFDKSFFLKVLFKVVKKGRTSNRMNKVKGQQGSVPSVLFLWPLPMPIFQYFCCFYEGCRALSIL